MPILKGSLHKAEAGFRFVRRKSADEPESLYERLKDDPKNTHVSAQLRDLQLGQRKTYVASGAEEATYRHAVLVTLCPSSDDALPLCRSLMDDDWALLRELFEETTTERHAELAAGLPATHERAIQELVTTKESLADDPYYSADAFGGEEIRAGFLADANARLDAALGALKGQPPFQAHAYIKVLSARNLGGGSKPCDPFVTVSFSSSPGDARKTGVVMQTANPEWNELVELSGTNPSGTLIVRVMEHNKLHVAQKCHGCVILDEAILPVNGELRDLNVDLKPARIAKEVEEADRRLRSSSESRIRSTSSTSVRHFLPSRSDKSPEGEIHLVVHYLKRSVPNKPRIFPIDFECADPRVEYKTLASKLCTVLDPDLDTRVYKAPGKEAQWLLDEIALRRGVSAVHRSLVHLEVIVDNLTLTFEGFDALYTAIEETRNCTAASLLTVAEAQLQCSLFGRIEKTIEACIKQFTTLFPENRPEGALARCIDVAFEIFGDDTSNKLLYFLKFEMDRRYCECFPEETLSLSCLAEASDLVFVEVYQCIHFYQRAFPPGSGLVRVVALKYYTKLRQDIKQFALDLDMRQANALDDAAGGASAAVAAGGDDDVIPLLSCIHKLHDMLEQIPGFTDDMPLLDMGALFRSFVEDWMRRSCMRVKEWVLEAVRVDAWKPVTTGSAASGPGLHSSSVGDAQEALEAAVSLFLDLRLEDPTLITAYSAYVVSVFEAMIDAFAGAYQQMVVGEAGCRVSSTATDPARSPTADSASEGASDSTAPGAVESSILGAVGKIVATPVLTIASGVTAVGTAVSSVIVGGDEAGSDEFMLSLEMCTLINNMEALKPRAKALLDALKVDVQPPDDDNDAAADVPELAQSLDGMFESFCERIDDKTVWAIGVLLDRIHESVCQGVEGILEAPATSQLSAEERVQSLCDMLDTLLGTLAQSLYASMLDLFVKRLWEVVIRSMDRLTHPSESATDRRICDAFTASTMRESLLLLIDFFHQGGDGLPLEMLEKKSQKLLELLDLFELDTASLIDLYGSNSSRSDDIVRVLAHRRESNEACKIVEQNQGKLGIGRGGLLRSDESVRARFGLSEIDNLVDAFFCVNHYGMQGFLYLTSNHLCFDATLLSDLTNSKLVLPLSDLAGIKRVTLFITGCLRVLTTDGRAFLFLGFLTLLSRNAAFRAIVKQCEERGVEIDTFGDGQAGPKHDKRGGFRLALMPSTAAMMTPVRRLFRIPDKEKQLYVCPATIQHSWVRLGDVYVFDQHLCFHSENAVHTMVSVIPFEQIVDVTKTGIAAIQVVRRKPKAGGEIVERTYTFRRLEDREELYGYILQQWKGDAKAADAFMTESEKNEATKVKRKFDLATVEKVLDWFSCTSEKHAHGTLYLTVNHVCFATTSIAGALLGGSRWSVPYTDIEDARKGTGRTISLDIELVKESSAGNLLTLNGFVTSKSRDTAMDIILTRLVAAESLVRAGLAPSDAGSDSSAVIALDPHEARKAELTEYVRAMFDMFDEIGSEQVVERFSCINTKSSLHGYLYVTDRSVLFHSVLRNAPERRLRIALADIVRVEKRWYALFNTALGIEVTGGKVFAFNGFLQRDTAAAAVADGAGVEVVEAGQEEKE